MHCLTRSRRGIMTHSITQKIIRLWLLLSCISCIEKIYSMEEVTTFTKKRRLVHDNSACLIFTLPDELIEEIAFHTAKNQKDNPLTPSRFRDLGNFINACRKTRSLINPVNIIARTYNQADDIVHILAIFLTTEGRHPKAMQTFARLTKIFDTGAEFCQSYLESHAISQSTKNTKQFRRKIELLAKTGFFKETENSHFLDGSSSLSVMKLMPKYLEKIQNIALEAPAELLDLTIEEYAIFRPHDAFLKLKTIIEEQDTNEIPTAAALVRANISITSEQLDTKSCRHFLRTLCNTKIVKNNRSAICHLLENGYLPRGDYSEKELEYITVIKLLANQIQNAKQTSK